MTEQIQGVGINDGKDFSEQSSDNIFFSFFQQNKINGNKEANAVLKIMRENNIHRIYDDFFATNPFYNSGAGSWGDWLQTIAYEGTAKEIEILSGNYSFLTNNDLNSFFDTQQYAKNYIDIFVLNSQEKEITQLTKDLFDKTADNLYLNCLSVNDNLSFVCSLNQMQQQEVFSNTYNGVLILQDYIIPDCCNFIMATINQIEFDDYVFSDYVSYNFFTENALVFKLINQMINDATSFLTKFKDINQEYLKAKNEDVKALTFLARYIDFVAKYKTINFYKTTYTNNANGLIDGVSDYNNLIKRLGFVFDTAVANRFFNIKPELDAIKKEFGDFDFKTPNSIIINDLLLMTSAINSQKSLQRKDFENAFEYFGATNFPQFLPPDISAIIQELELTVNEIDKSQQYLNKYGIWTINFKEWDGVDGDGVYHPEYDYNTEEGKNFYDVINKIVSEIADVINDTLGYIIQKLVCFKNNLLCLINLIISTIQTINDIANFIADTIDYVENTINNTINEAMGFWNDIVATGVASSNFPDQISQLLSDPTDAINCVFQTIFSQVYLTVNNFPTKSEVENYADKLNKMLPDDLIQINACKMSFTPPELPSFDLNLGFDLGKIKIPDIAKGVIDINLDLDCQNGTNIDASYRTIE